MSSEDAMRQLAKPFLHLHHEAAGSKATAILPYNHHLIISKHLLGYFGQSSRVCLPRGGNGLELEAGEEWGAC